MESPKHKANSATTTLQVCLTTELRGSELYGYRRQMTIPLDVCLQDLYWQETEDAEVRFCQ